MQECFGGFKILRFQAKFLLSVRLNVTLYENEDVYATLKYLTKMFMNH